MQHTHQQIYTESENEIKALPLSVRSCSFARKGGLSGKQSDRLGSSGMISFYSYSHKATKTLLFIIKSFTLTLIKTYISLLWLEPAVQCFFDETNSIKQNKNILFLYFHLTTIMKKRKYKCYFVYTEYVLHIYLNIHFKRFTTLLKLTF